MSNITYNPQQPSNLNTTGSNSTTRYFNNFFLPKNSISQNTNDAILSFFEEQTGNRESALLLSQAVIDTAQAKKEDPMTVLTEFQKLSQDKLTALLSLYLNASRVNTSLLGIKNIPKTNSYVSRTIIT